MAKTKFKENFKEILKELRKKKNLTQRGLAEKTGISLAMITKYEQGLNTPSIENLRVLADFFKVPIRNFLEDRNSDRFFKDFFSEEEANIDIENYDFSTNDEKFLSISKGKQFIYHILKFLEAVGFEIYIDEEKNVFNIRSSDPEYLVNIYWTINNLQFQIQFLRNIIIDYSYMFFKDMDNHIKKIENDNTENNNTKDFDVFDEKISELYQERFPDSKDVKKFRENYEITLHHEGDGFEVVDRTLHQYFTHTGERAVLEYEINVEKFTGIRSTISDSEYWYLKNNGIKPKDYKIN